ncbi:hypothetical protein OH805_23800 [Streptomyces sp. NBC_00879]|uniref:hypothetical protein n=1 Tax=Streptomyces sp. NBC_00879 TaxID=2975855 RepID=UPI00386F5C80|nr:hypothetical protein OH805_23800 [Streptomyces sp. NBC_00879]
MAIVHSNSGGGWTKRARSSCADARGVKALDERLPAARETATAKDRGMTTALPDLPPSGR